MRVNRACGHCFHEAVLVTAFMKQCCVRVLGTASCWYHHTRPTLIPLQLKPLRLTWKKNRLTLPQVSEVLDYV